MRTITSKVAIPMDRQLHISVPEDIPPGPAEIVLVIVPETTLGKRLNAGDLLWSPLFGIWKERTDIEDSVEYARKLRAKAEQRSHELEQMGKLVNVTSLVRQHIEALSRVHQELRKHTSQDIDAWEQMVDTVLRRARESFGHALSGLAVVAGEQRDIYDRSEPICGDLLARRMFLQRKNSNLGFLSRRYVSGTCAENAV